MHDDEDMHGQYTQCPPHTRNMQCDIALLTVEDDEFWEGVEGLEIGGLPHMQESVVVVGVSCRARALRQLLQLDADPPH